jgi:hypothetical protein
MERGERLDKHFGNCADSVAVVGRHRRNPDLRFRVTSSLPAHLAGVKMQIGSSAPNGRLDRQSEVVPPSNHPTCNSQMAKSYGIDKICRLKRIRSMKEAPSPGVSDPLTIASGR